MIVSSVSSLMLQGALVLVKLRPTQLMYIRGTQLMFCTSILAILMLVNYELIIVITYTMYIEPNFQLYFLVIHSHCSFTKRHRRAHARGNIALLLQSRSFARACRYGHLHV